MSGYDICRQMRDEKIMVPILVLSAKSEIDNKVELLAAGADDYLEKPFSKALDIELNTTEHTISRLTSE